MIDGDMCQQFATLFSSIELFAFNYTFHFPRFFFKRSVLSVGEAKF